MPLSLFEAVRLSLSMDPNHADVAYWNWRELRSFLESVHASMNAVLSQRGVKPANVALWAIQQEREVGEVRDFVAIAGKTFPSTYPVGQPRHQAPKMVNKGQIVGALSNTLGVLQCLSGAEWREVISSCATGDSTSNESFLLELDQRCGRHPRYHEVKTRSLIPGAIARIQLLDTRLRYREDERPRAYAVVLKELHLNGLFDGSNEAEIFDGLSRFMEKLKRTLRALDQGKDQDSDVLLL